MSEQEMIDNPEIGERRWGWEIGKNNKGRYTFAVCSECGTPRWTMNPDRVCRKCSDKVRSLWKKLPDRESIVVGKHTKYKDNCPGCGCELWRHREYIGKPCRSCSVKETSKKGADNHNWNGGRHLNAYGYYEVSILRSDPFFCMSRKNKNVVLEHRLVMARILGRPLETWEVVHHKNSVKTDNRPENLELVIQAKNVAYSRMEITVNQLIQRISDLEKETRLLHWILLHSRHGNPEPSLPNEQISRQEGVETRSEDCSTNKLHSAPHPDKQGQDDDIVQSARNGRGELALITGTGTGDVMDGKFSDPCE